MQINLFQLLTNNNDYFDYALERDFAHLLTRSVYFS